MLVLIILGFFVGIISGFFGIGGGMIIVPTLTFLGFGIKEAVGISVFQMLIGSIIGSYFNYKNANFKIKEAIFLGLGALSGAGLSGFVLVNIDEIVIKIALLIALLLSMIKMYFTNINKEQKEISKILFFIIGFCVALPSISMGIGGAIFLTPILSGIFGIDLKKSISLGLFFVIFSSFSGFLSMSFFGLINYKIGFILASGTIFGVYFGTKFHNLVSKNTQKTLLLVLYILMFLLTLKSIF